MRYLNSFNEAKKGYTSDLIERLENSIISGGGLGAEESLEFTTKDINYIKGIVSKYDINYKRGDIVEVNDGKYSSWKNKSISINGVASLPIITKAADDYYYVEGRSGRSYKCDSLKGLEDCLTNIFLKAYEKVDNNDLKNQLWDSIKNKSREEIVEIINSIK